MNFIKYGSFAPINLDKVLSFYIQKDADSYLIIFDCIEGNHAWFFNNDIELNKAYKKLIDYTKPFDLETGNKTIDQDGDIEKHKTKEIIELYNKINKRKKNK